MGIKVEFGPFLPVALDGHRGLPHSPVFYPRGTLPVPIEEEAHFKLFGECLNDLLNK